MEPMELIQYSRVPGLPDNPFTAVTNRRAALLKKLKNQYVSGGVVDRINTQFARLTYLKSSLMHMQVEDVSMEKAAEEVETLLAALNRDISLLEII